AHSNAETDRSRVRRVPIGRDPCRSPFLCEIVRRALAPRAESTASTLSEKTHFEQIMLGTDRTLSQRSGTASLPAFRAERVLSRQSTQTRAGTFTADRTCGRRMLFRSFARALMYKRQPEAQKRVS